ncbi:MAG TPA: helix-turn-helix domain-containing protein, partial [Chromatiaceae bacterium]|nr:helix-turn-helix domain-containing protein [Chromatiaceae bacterium]
MTDPSEPRPDEEAVEATGAEPPPGPGQRLRQARLRRGLDLTQVARDLRLTPERVKAIENEDYSRL